MAHESVRNVCAVLSCPVWSRLVLGGTAAVLQGYMKAAESSDEDLVAALSSIYSNRAIGKELQMDVDSHGPAQASMQEVGASTAQHSIAWPDTAARHVRCQALPKAFAGLLLGLHGFVGLCACLRCLLCLKYAAISDDLISARQWCTKQ